MNSRAKVTRTLGLVVFVVGSILSGQAQVSKSAPASVSQIEDEIKQHPDSPKLYVALGLAYWDRNDYPHALEAFQRAVNWGPNSAEAQNWLGVATLENGDVPGAITDFRKAVSLDPK
jgi:Flp pilus assembly protein TadD